MANTKNAQAKKTKPASFVKRPERFGEVRRRVTKKFTMPSRTIQSEAHNANINNIMAKYEKTGVLDHVNRRQPIYGIAPSYDFQEAVNMVQSAQEAFSELPAALRRDFNDDPAAFAEYVANPENLATISDMGLVDPSEADIPRGEPSPEGDPQEAESPAE